MTDYERGLRKALEIVGTYNPASDFAAKIVKCIKAEIGLEIKTIKNLKPHRKAEQA